MAAIAANGVIGSGGRLPWRLRDDLRRFRALTIGHAVIMGRSTFRSLGRPLPGRRNLVLSRQPGLEISGCRVVHSRQEALEAVADESEAFVIGGAAIYALFLPDARRLFITWIDVELPGDTLFPAMDWSQWRLARATIAVPHPTLPHRFADYERVEPADGA